MVTIKGIAITTQTALISIEAMERLVYLYKNPEQYTGCPLCRVLCHRCPWFILKGHDCVGSWFSNVISDSRATRNRIRQLERWIEIYKKALKK